MRRIFIVIIGLFFQVLAHASTYVYHDGRETVSRVLSLSLSASTNRDIPALRSPDKQLIDGDLIITVGRDSFVQVCDVEQQVVLIALFLGEEEYSQLKQQCSKPTTAIFSGAPISLRLNILNTFWEDQAPIGIIYSEGLDVSNETLGVTEDTRFEILTSAIPLGSREEKIKSLTSVLDRSNLVLSLYDSMLFNAQFSKDAIRLMFHKKKSLAAHSLQLVRAGALFSVYSTSQDKMALTSSYINVFEASATLMPSSYPSPLKVAFNPYLIRMYGLVLPTDQFLMDKFGVCPESGCQKAFY
ncbi:hypothetical protein [Marinomonas atlantica]|uniref:hypothetical protein n=1 Tax=Marinomonas atlantica TaxID=1806668 RepID=UPI0012E7B8E1|nr:hypothetical protein [Marinomonas atlantica]